MKIEVENKPNCIAEARIEVPSERVNEVYDKILADFRRFAKLPGFRPGKAPRGIVERKYGGDIQEELTRTLVSEGTRAAIKENDLRVLTVSGVSDVEYADDKTMTYKATIVTSPDFELPEYKGIGVKAPSLEVGEDEIGDMLESLRERGAEYEDVEGRAAEIDDYVVIDYKGTCEGQPIGEVAPKAGRNLTENSDFWLRMAEDAFLPGFSAELAGMNPGESREFDLEMPPDFPVEELGGRTLHFAVTLKAVRRQILPEIDDALAEKLVPGKSLEELREMISGQIARRKEDERRNAIQHQVIDYLLGSLEFELPENFVRDETRRTLEDIVRENQMRGVSDDELEENREKLVEGAERGARNRLKTTFILLRIADKEGIEVTSEDMSERIATLAMRYRMKPDKLLKELEKRDALDNVREEVLTGKTLDFIVSNASIEEVPTGRPAES